MVCQGTAGKGIIISNILMFGPPGTGKTMIAKAIATEAGANFINVTMSSVSFQHMGESEKQIKAVFTLAKKLAPSIIFFDEVDSLLASREYIDSGGDGSIALRSMKTEFFTSWDGLLSKDSERIMVLGATNRPFDLDEAAIRRFSRRLMVGLPDEQNLVKILKCILEDEEALAPNFNFEEVAKFTNNYSGSDLKNLCVAAAHCRVQELMESVEKGKRLSGANKDLRPLSMEDIKYASEQVRPSTQPDSILMQQLLEWNDTHGKGGGSRKTQNLSYYL